MSYSSVAKVTGRGGSFYPTLVGWRYTLLWSGRYPVAFPDPIGGGCNVFLLTEEGQPELLAVHDALYDGILAAPGAA
jgi:hypothetical protein